MTNQIIRSIVLSGSQEQLVLGQITCNLSSIGDTTKKTINKTLAIGAAFTAAVILAPATFAHEHHEPHPTNGIQLATDIIRLVRAVVEPRPAPVVVETTLTVVEKTVVVETTPTVVATTQKVVTPPPATVIVTGAEEVGIPEYSYVLYEDEYIPYYEGWLYIEDEWYWAGTEPRPAVHPRWTPPPRHHDNKPHKIIVLPDHHLGLAPFPVIRREEPRHAPATVIRREEPRREPARTAVVKQEKKEEKGGQQKPDAPPAKKR